MNPNTAQIWLASASPRRAELLQQMGICFVQQGVDCDESPKQGESPLQLVQRLARDKAAVAWNSQAFPGLAVLAADTLIDLDGISLGKPATPSACDQILRSLSGRCHDVHTALCLQSERGVWQQTQTSKVCFRVLSDAEIQAYCATDEPYDKAGAYAVQGLAGIFIESISGSYSGIMGLPVFETAGLLRQAGIEVLETS